MQGLINWRFFWVYLKKFKWKGVNLAKRQALKMCNFRSSLQIYLKFLSDISHYNIFACVNFYGCSLKVEKAVAYKIKIGALESLTQAKLSDFYSYATAV